jgi:hypothetical protein
MDYIDIAIRKTSGEIEYIHALVIPIGDHRPTIEYLTGDNVEEIIIL